MSAETVAFRMQLKPGFESEYRRRHDAIWPELAQALRDAGVIDYRIFLDPDSLVLLAVMTRRTDHELGALRNSPLMERWWAMMADIMETTADSAPREWPLSEMFVLAPT